MERLLCDCLRVFGVIKDLQNKFELGVIIKDQGILYKPQATAECLRNEVCTMLNFHVS